MEPPNQKPPAAPIPLSYAEPPRKRTGFALAGLICGIIGMPTSFFLGVGLPISLAALILGIIALVKIRRTPEITGKNMAIAAIVTSGIGFLLFGMCAFYVSGM